MFRLVNHRSSPPPISRPKGTTIWGTLVIIGMIILLIGISYNPTASLRKQLLKEIEKLDGKRNEVLRRISGGSSFSSSEKDFKDLSDKEKYRYEAAISYFEQAQNAILNFYKYPSSSVGFSKQVYQITLVLGLILLFSILAITTLRLVNTDIGLTPIDIGSSPLPKHSGFLESRILNLEAAKSGRARLLIYVFIGGVMSIAMNYLLGSLRAKRVARSETRLRLIHYENKLKNRIISKTKVFERSISEVENKLNDMESKLNSRISELGSLGNSTVNTLNYTCNQEIKSINKESKKSENHEIVLTLWIC